MTFLTLLIGIMGLGIVIFIHELGHLIVARLTGIHVEAFAIGWGRTLYVKERWGIEWRLNMLPIGGYCQMRGEEDLRRAIRMKASSFDSTEGSLFSVHPWKRILTYLAGPFSNFLLAIMLFSCVWYFGYSYASYDNRIIRTSDYPEIFSGAGTNPLDAYEIQTGSRILSIDGTSTENYDQIHAIISRNHGIPLNMTFQLPDGEEVTHSITPELNQRTGTGYIGIYSWIEPIIANVLESSPASAAGLRESDIITSADGEPVMTALDLFRAFSKSSDGIIEVVYMREGRSLTTQLVPIEVEEGAFKTGASFRVTTYHTPRYDLLESLQAGSRETLETLAMTLQGLRSLTKGLDVTKALSGPLKISYIIGETTTQGFSGGIWNGLRTLAQLIGFISVALCFANLLPIPALDGGQIVVSTIEWVIGRQLHPKVYYRIQLIGFAIIMVLLAFTLFNDALFLFNQP